MFDLTILWTHSPYIFSSDFISVRYYSLFFALGIIFVYVKTIIKLSKDINPKILDDVFIPCILFMLLFSRIFHCLFYEFTYYSTNPIEIFLPFRLSPFEFTGYQGLSSHGGFAGFIFSFLIFYRKKMKFNLSIKFLDTVFYYSIILIGFIRLGNFFNSEILGKACTNSLCIIFPLFDSVPRYPVQLYESLTYFVIYIGLSFFREKIEAVPGRLLLLTVLFVSISRFLLEFLKDIQSDINIGVLTMGQLLTIPIVLISIIAFLVLNGIGKKYR